tara:strand:+ start:363 stop:563 length:201 start_codon:yes stop_codon:yes gene_type:complete
VAKGSDPTNYTAALTKAIVEVRAKTRYTLLALEMIVGGVASSESFSESNDIALLRSTEMDSYDKGK